MSTTVTQLPQKVTEKLNRYVPRDATVFYDENLGWVFERRSDGNGPQLKATKLEQKNVEPEENQSPMKQLGPFGTFSQTIVHLGRLGDPFTFFRNVCSRNPIIPK